MIIFVQLPNYSALLGEIKQRIRAAQYEALKAVNKKLIDLYWDIWALDYRATNR